MRPHLNTKKLDAAVCQLRRNKEGLESRYGSGSVFFMWHMAQIVKHHQFGARDVCREPLATVQWDQIVFGSPDNEGGHFQAFDTRLISRRIIDLI